MNHPYSMLLNICGRMCLVVGGGRVAERKINNLLEAGASLTVISPEFSSRLQTLGSEGRISLIRREYLPGDIGVDCTLVFAATNSEQVNLRVYEDALSFGRWVYVADRPELCTFTLPSVMRRGKLIISVSTGGASPSLARSLTKRLEEDYGEEYELYLDFLAELRSMVQSRVKDKEKRQQMFKRMLLWDVLPMIRSGTFQSWKEELMITLEQEPMPETIAAFIREAEYK